MTPQSEFIAAILDPAAPVPADLRGPEGRPAVRRFDVYRNNVAVGLTEALKTAFPVVHQLVGAAFFRAMAGVFLRSHPPTSPVMMHYGAEMAEFLDAFAPVASLVYLPDVARLEQARREAYHAADADVFDATILRDLAPEELLRAQVRFVPAVRLLRSAHPVLSIWRANSDTTAPRPLPGAEAVLVSRPGFDPVLDPLDPAQLDFCRALADGQTLEAALAAAGPDLDLASTLSLLLARRAIAALLESPAP